MLRAMLTTIAALALTVMATALPAAADEAGKVVSLEGTVEIGVGGNWNRASVGSPVSSGDTIRTGNPGRARILFRDESVLNLGDASTLLIDESVFNPDRGTATTLLHLLGGKVRALVSDYYSDPQASYRIETTTAVSGVRGTEFVVVHDAGREVTEVLGLGGRVAVHSVLDRKKRGVMIHARELTTVGKGQFPTPPRQIEVDDERFLQLMSGLDLPGSGIPESIVQDDPVVGGSKPVDPKDSADGAGQGAAAPKDGKPLTDYPPSDPAHTGGDLTEQPLPVLEAPTDVDIHF